MNQTDINIFIQDRIRYPFWLAFHTINRIYKHSQSDTHTRVSYISTHTHTHTLARTHNHTHTHTMISYISTHTYVHSCTHAHTHTHTHSSYITLIGVHEMHGRMYPNLCHVTVLLPISIWRSNERHSHVSTCIHVTATRPAVLHVAAVYSSSQV